MRGERSGARHLRVVASGPGSQETDAIGEGRDPRRAADWLRGDRYESEARSLSAVLRQSQETRTGRTVLLTGPAEGGRSTLLREMAAHAADSGFAVADVHGTEDHQHPLRALLAGLSSGRTPVLSREAARAVAAVRDNPLLQMRMLHRLLRCHARTRSVLVTIDAPHEMNPGSRWVISQLPALLADCAIVWVHSAPDWYLADLAVEAPGIQLLAKGQIVLAPLTAVGRRGPHTGPGWTFGGSHTGAATSTAPPHKRGADATVSGARPRFGWASLTPCELRIARLVAQGLSNRAVADALFVSPNTVGTHLRSVFSKLDVNSRVQLTRYVIENATEAVPAQRPGTSRP